MDLGSYLRDLRERSKTPKVADVSAATGIPKPTIYMWEGPRSRPDPVDIRKLCTFYGASEDQIAESLRLRSLVVDGHDLSPVEAA